MNVEKMREEFEEWYRAEYLCAMPIATINSRMNRDAYGDYFDVGVRRSWLAWQASRASLVVELPPTVTVEDVAEAVDLEDERALTVTHMINGAISACGSFIKAAGITCK